MSCTEADSQETLGAIQDNLDANQKSYLTGRFYLLRHLRENVSRLFAGLSEISEKVLGRWRVVSVLPLILLLIGVSTVFFFGSDRGYFYRPVAHAFTSSQTLSRVSHFSPATHFIDFDYKMLDEFGNPSYLLYGRFPLGGLALIKLAIVGFDDLSTRIYAASTLVLIFFVGTIVLAYWSLCRLTSSKWIALSATALAFSSGYLLYFNDLLSTEWSIDLFGCLLVFHGMILFVLESRFRQLVVKSCVALLLGWHVLAVLMPFIVLGLFKESIRGSISIRDYGFFKRVLTKIRVGVVTAVTSRYMVLGIIVASLSILVLVNNVGNQYYFSNIENDFDIELFDLPVFESVAKRIGVGADQGIAADQAVAEAAEWPAFLRSQFVHIGYVSIPFALPGYSSLPSWWEEGSRLFGVSELQSLFIGIVVVGICVIRGFFGRYRLLTMTAVLSGFCWTIPWRYNAIFHYWESMYYVGLPLVALALIFTFIRKLSNETFIGYTSVVAVLIFVFSNYQVSSVSNNNRFSAEFHQTMMDDFNVIRRFTKDSSVLVPVSDVSSDIIEFDGVGHGLFYYLYGSSIVFNWAGCHADNVDYIPDEVDFIIQTRRDIPGLLTPKNQMVYLYDNYVYEREIDRLVKDNYPFYSYSGLDVYLTGDRRLFYIGSRCKIPNVLLDSRFFLEIVPVLVDDLPEQRRSYGYDRLDFYFDEHYILDTKRHILVLELPDYDIASIRTGQLTGDDDLIWEGELDLLATSVFGGSRR